MEILRIGMAIQLPALTVEVTEVLLVQIAKETVASLVRFVEVMEV